MRLESPLRKDYWLGIYFYHKLVDKYWILLIAMYFETIIQGPFGLKGKEGGVVEGRRVKLAKNNLILDQFYSTPPPSPSIH